VSVPYTPEAASIPDASPSAHHVDGQESVGHAMFSPFGNVGLVVQVPGIAAAPQEFQGGDWSLPVAVSVAGFVAIGWILRIFLR